MFFVIAVPVDDTPAPDQRGMFWRHAAPCVSDQYRNTGQYAGRTRPNKASAGTIGGAGLRCLRI